MLCTKYKLGCAVQRKRVYQTQEPYRIETNTMLTLQDNILHVVNNK